jgi:hypothetical protein
MELLRQAARLAGRKNPQFESLTEINHAGWKIRIWRTAKTLGAAQAFDHASMQYVMRETIVATDDWFEALLALPNVACVAIVDQTGNGASAYPDWS